MALFEKKSAKIYVRLQIMFYSIVQYSVEMILLSLFMRTSKLCFACLFLSFLLNYIGSPRYIFRFSIGKCLSIISDKTFS